MVEMMDGLKDKKLVGKKVELRAATLESILVDWMENKMVQQMVCLMVAYSVDY